MQAKCKSCGICKPLDEFHKEKRNKNGHFSSCKACLNAKNLAWYNSNKEQARKSGSDWDKENKHKRAEYKLKHRYGIDMATYDLMVTAQKGKCAICDREAKLFVDHCHSSGQVRGLLCNNCNIGIGSFEDNTIYLSKAADYLSAGKK